MTLLIIVLVILVFGLLVFVHELGHFVVAKRAGVEVEEFGFGFPPRLVGVQVGPTIYSLNWIPLGGFVRMKGESLSDLRPGTFGAASFWSKTRILFAGVTMNAATTYIVLLYLCLTGLPPVIANQVSIGHPSYAQSKQVMVLAVEPGSPAAAVSLQQGDLVLSGDGQAFTSEDQLMAFTKHHAGQQVTLRVSHQNSVRTLQLRLRPASAKLGFLGVTPFQTDRLRYALGPAIATAAGITVQLVWATLGAFIGLIVGLFAHGQVSGEVTGPVGIVVLLKNVVNLGLAYVLIVVASISISLAVINALPLPALDGGRWALTAASWVARRRISERLETAINATGFAALILLMLVVTFFDIKRLHQ